MSLIKAFGRLLIQRTDLLNKCQAVAGFHNSGVLYAEPLKKKKKLDPQIIKHREERRKKKLEKQIRRLEKNARQLKPIEELEVPMDLLDNKEQRTRTLPPLTTEEIERRIRLHERWARYKHEQKLQEFQIMDRLMESQNRALEELRYESEELYLEAIQPDTTMLPIKLRGPVSTPPIQNYDPPDGEYIRAVKKWD